jgi:peroxiredoxin Q/BCP
LPGACKRFINRVGRGNARAARYCRLETVSALRKDQFVMIETGKPFPDFALPNQDGKVVRLGDFRGKWLVVYVYPKDDTPGCTIQGQSFTATKSDFEDAGIGVVGVSQDDVGSHKKFCDKFGFTIDLLADTDAELLQSCGIGQSEWQGTKYWERTSFVIDPNGVLRRVYEKVNPQGHERTLLDDIKQLQGGRTIAHS